MLRYFKMWIELHEEKRNTNEWKNLMNLKPFTTLFVLNFLGNARARLQI